MKSQHLNHVKAKVKQYVSAVLVTVAPTIGFAQGNASWEKSFFIGAGASYAGLTVGSYGGLNNSTDSSDFDVGFVLSGGYQFSRHIAIEARYLNADGARYTAAANFTCVGLDICTVDITQDTVAFSVAGVGILPLGNTWSGYAKLGASAWQATADQSNLDFNGNFLSGSRVDSDGTGLLIGFGVAAIFSPRVRLRLDYEFFDTDKELAGVDRAAGFQQIALEMNWRF